MGVRLQGLKVCKMSCGSLSDGEAPSSTCQPSDALAAGESEEGNVARRAGRELWKTAFYPW